VNRLLRHFKKSKVKSPLLDVVNLYVTYGSGENLVRAVNCLSFQLKQGETLGIVGESGSGKSTAALSIMGLLPNSASYSSEKLEFHSRSGINHTLNEKSVKAFRGREMSMIFQDPSLALNPVQKCGNQVIEPLRVHLKQSQSEAKRNCLKLLEDVGLDYAEEIAQAYPHELSGGQKQRIMIAMAMACQPSLLFADEPTTALDVTVQSTILDLLNRLKNQGQMSMVFISHDMAVVSKMADRVLVMKDGVLLEEGKTVDVFTNPKQAYTRGLLACRPPLYHRYNRLPTVEEFLQAENTGKQPEITLEEPSKRAQRHAEIYSKEPILRVRDLNVSYSLRAGFLSFIKKKKPVLHEINLELYKGETLGLVGESGSGKTTFGKAILKLIPTDSGKVIFLGKDLIELSTAELRSIRKDIQMVFQDPFSSLDPRKTIAEILLEPMRAQKILKTDKERIFFIGGILQKVKLEGKVLKRYPNEFSGGQRQRIGIARALTLSPQCIVFDESVSSLDVSVQAQVLNLINDLKRDLEFSCIFISHDLAVVRYMSDRLLVMENGKIVESGDSDSLFANPQHPYTQKLIGAIPTTKF
jgi:peptide/nickel transport system ATP-binding protein